LWRDEDGNGIMEFGAPGELRPGRWTNELNFLAWQQFDEEPRPDLLPQSKVRLSLQWTEAHDPEFARAGEDLFRRPLAIFRLVVLRQRDPKGTRLPADDMEVIAFSSGLPQRLDNEPAQATYEQWVEFSADRAGRYAVLMEGRVPTGTRPLGTPTIAAIQAAGEIRPRLFVEATDGALRLRGRVVFLDYFTDAGSLGIPAGAAGVVTIGAADAAGRPESFSSVGPPLGRGLLVKPNGYAPAAFSLSLGEVPAAYGTSLATPLAAGIAAARLSAGLPPPGMPSAPQAVPCPRLPQAGPVPILGEEVVGP
jgi:hypothetical protein